MRWFAWFPRVMKYLPQVWPFKHQERVSFSFEAQPSTLFGTIYRPMATVNFWSPTQQAWQQYRLLVDSGADYTLIPRYMAVLIGLNLADGKRLQTTGVGGQHSTIFFPAVKVSLGTNFERTIPVGVVDAKIPPLMGRQLFLETFETTFEYHKKLQFRVS